MPRIEGEPCFILHQRPYRETSALLEVFSLDHGRFSLVARGLRGGGRGRQAWRSGLQPFNLLGLSWSGRGELKTLTDVQLQHGYALSGRALFCGFYLNELLERLLHRFDPHPTIFHHYQYGLLCLAKGEEKICLRRFEFALLAELGYGFNFARTAEGDPIRAEGRYRYEVERGFVAVPDSSARGMLGTHLQCLAQEEYSVEAEAVARQLSRMLINHLLGGRVLRSRELFATNLGGDSAGEND